MWGNNIIATVRITEKGFYEFCNFDVMSYFLYQCLSTVADKISVNPFKYNTEAMG